MSEIDDSFAEAFGAMSEVGLALNFTYATPTVTFAAVPAFRDPGKRPNELRSSDNSALVIEVLTAALTAGLPAVGSYVTEVASGQRRRVEHREVAPDEPVVRLRLGTAFTPSTP